MLDVFRNAQGLSKEDIKTVISIVENICKEHPEQLNIPITNHFSKNVYAREMKLPAGALIIGKIHKHQNLNILSEGEVSVLTADKGSARFKAPHTFVADPGAQRLIYAHTDVTWTTIHGTDETDLEKIEDEVIAKSFDDVVALDDKKLKELSK